MGKLSRGKPIHTSRAFHGIASTTQTKRAGGQAKRLRKERADARAMKGAAHLTAYKTLIAIGRAEDILDSLDDEA